MADDGSFWDDGIEPNLTVFAGVAASNPAEVMADAVDYVVGYAQENAPWQDRTGEARGGLNAVVEEGSDEIYLVLFHTAEHGYWLELIQSGRFAIIMPTLEALAPEIFHQAGASMFEVF